MIRKGQRTLPKGTEPHLKRKIPPQLASRSFIPSVSHRTAIPGRTGPRKQGVKGK